MISVEGLGFSTEGFGNLGIEDLAVRGSNAESLGV